MIATKPQLADRPVSRCRFSGLCDELAEYYRILLSRLPWLGNGSRDAVRTLGVQSCHSGEGVSTVAAHLAATAASVGDRARRILLTDFNLARPSAHRTFELNPGPGVAEALLGLGPSVQTVFNSNLSVLTAGTADDDLQGAYDSDRLQELVKGLRADFDLVVFDMPAAERDNSAVCLAGLLDGLLLVVEAERVCWEAARATKERLTRSGANLLGVVLNKRRQHLPDWLYRAL